MEEKKVIVATGKYGPLVGAIDQGTSSSRFMVFAANTSELLTYHQVEIGHEYPRDGWVEEKPSELLDSVRECIKKTCENLTPLGVNVADIKAVGITNQRETTILWDKYTGEALHNAILWLDSRTAETVKRLLETVPDHNKDYFKSRCGLPISTYFSALKINWLMKNIPAVRQAIKEDRCLFGTVDSWLIWNLTGGPNGGLHMTDVTNASRTMLMNIETLQWDEQLCKFFEIPMSLLPKIYSSSEIYGKVTMGQLRGLPISGCLGDQHAALVGQMCFQEGQAKNTYGTGCFLLYNTGHRVPRSEHGMLTTVAYQLGKNARPCYALEGSIAVAGAAIKWLKDNLHIADSADEVERLAASVPDTAGVYFVPAFSGLYAPYWRAEARGAIFGASHYTTNAHVARACLEAVCFQTREILEAMSLDSGIRIRRLLVDGGMTKNRELLQMQANVLGIPTIRPCMTETTALGAAMAAGSAEGVEVWNLNNGADVAVPVDTFQPSITEEERNYRFKKWKTAIQLSLLWADETHKIKDDNNRLLASIPGTWFLITTFGLMVLAQVLKQR